MIQRPTVVVLALATAFGLPFLGRTSTPVFKSLDIGTQPPSAERAATRLPVALIANRGQWDPAAKFQSRSGNATTWLVDNGLRVSLTPTTSGIASAVFISFEGNATTPVGESEQAGRFNFFIGSDESKWCADVPAYSQVRYPNVASGIDAVVGERNGRLEWDVVVAPHAKLENFSFRVQGADSLSIRDGSLVATTGVGELVQTPPVAWDMAANGTETPVVCRYVDHGNGRFGFEAINHDHNSTLVVDPGLIYSGYLGGSSYDSCYAITTDASGQAFVTGRTNSANFPTVPGSFDVSLYNTVYDVFVTKINSSGTARVYSTFLGGSGSDWGNAIKVDGAGAAYVTGMCDNNFPVTSGSYDTSYNSFGDVFVTKIQPAGNALAWSTYLGGNNEDRGQALALDPTGTVYVAGQCVSSNFPATSGAYDTTANGSWDAFVAKFSSNGANLVYSTRIGGSALDWAMSLAVDTTGAAYVGGGTQSQNFPTTAGAYDRTFNGGSLDCFVAKFAPNGASLNWSTYIGGTGTDQVFGLALDSNNNVCLTGGAGFGFPSTPGALIGASDGADAYATCLSSNGSSLVWSTLIGGSSTDQGNEVCVDSTGRVVIAGWTNSNNFPTTPGAFSQTFFGGGSPADTFVVKIQPGGSVLIYGSYVGGNSYDEGTSVAVDGTSNVYVCGGGQSSNIQVTSPALAGPGGLDDGFVVKLQLPASPAITTLGRGCGANVATPTLGSGLPTIGQPVSISGINAQPGSAGYVIVSDLPTSTTSLGGNCEMYCSPLTAIVFTAFIVPSSGAWVVTPPVSNNPVLQNQIFRVQTLFASPTSPFGFELTNGVEAQPGY